MWQKIVTAETSWAASISKLKWAEHEKKGSSMFLRSVFCLRLLWIYIVVPMCLLDSKTIFYIIRCTFSHVLLYVLQDVMWNIYYKSCHARVLCRSSPRGGAGWAVRRNTLCLFYLCLFVSLCICVYVHVLQMYLSAGAGWAVTRNSTDVAGSPLTTPTANRAFQAFSTRARIHSRHRSLSFINCPCKHSLSQPGHPSAPRQKFSKSES